MGLVFAIVIAGAAAALFFLLPTSATASTRGTVPVPGKTKLPLETAVLKMAKAITRHETGYTGSVFPPDPRFMVGLGPKNKNPGNLRFIGQKGAIGKDSQNFAVFGTMQAGWDALLRDVRAKITGNTRTSLGPGSTLVDFISVYAPRTENDVDSYVSAVERETGVNRFASFNQWVDV